MSNKSLVISKKSMLALSISAALTLSAGAEETNSAETVKKDEAIEVIGVTGYRGSLLNSTNAKRESNGFTDEVFADDIGKMPSLNLAESIARIPGVKIGRTVTGEGQQISVRGLGSEFTKMVVNGNSMAVASTGDINANSNGRQIDLDMFPTELFTGISVAKTATASQIEGGVSGYIDLRTARASDKGEGHNISFSVDGEYNDNTESINPKAAFTYSYSSDTFGILATIISKKGTTGVDGYETVGNIAQTGCIAAQEGSGCLNEGESGTFRYNNRATADYIAKHGGSIGDLIDVNQVSGLTDAQILGFGMPYIGRTMTMESDKTNLSSLVSFQYQINDDMEFSFDWINADVEKDSVRTEFMHIYRRNYDTPNILSNIELVDNGNGDRLQSGTFYGSRPWVGSRDYENDLSFYSIMPSFSWQVNDNFYVDISASKTSSDFEEDNPYGLFYVAEGTMTYDNNGAVPSVNHSALDNYDDYLWQSLRFSHKERQTETDGIHIDFEWGEDASSNGIKFGFSSDTTATSQQVFHADDLAAHLEANGLDELENNMGSFITNVNIGSSYKSEYNGLTSFGDLDWEKFKNTINYNSIANAVGTSTEIEEEVTAFYVEVNTETELAGQYLRTNAGVRYVSTDQYVATISGETNEEYKRVLPSFSAVYDATDDVKLRLSASRSLTRADPGYMFPNSAWSGSGIEAVSAGNPKLSPFESTNFDIGGEYYFGNMGYVGLTYYRKDITGFTLNDVVQVDFNDLPEWGMDISDLSKTQEDELSLCQPNCVTSVTTRVNTKGNSTLTGWEVVWVQPLDFIVEGLGFNASANKIKDESPEGAEITGVSDSYNATVYYENEIFQTRITVNHQDGGYQFNSWGSDINGRDRTQIDLSASYDLPVLQNYNLTVTFDAYNLTNEDISSNIEEDDTQTFNAYFPGATYSLGIRGSF
ncbi:MAG: TonB-dependent receptor [Colwellia sp.]